MIATTGCIWMLFNRPPKPSAPCALRIVDDVPPYQPPDDVIWSWLRRYQKPAGTVYVAYSADDDRVSEGLRQYKLSHPGAAEINYFSSLGMSCRAASGVPTCKRDLTVRYVCVPVQPTSVADSELPKYEAILSVTVRFGADGRPEISSGMVGKGGPLWPPDRPPIARR